eukprot:scaffold16492_cov72-Skeletonema_dohrnii-CCMP3373.AAC.3
MFWIEIIILAVAVPVESNLLADLLHVRSTRQAGDFRSRTDFAAVGWRLQPFAICSLACSEMTLKGASQVAVTSAPLLRVGEMISVEVDLGIRDKRLESNITTTPSYHWDYLSTP